MKSKSVFAALSLAAVAALAAPHSAHAAAAALGTTQQAGSFEVTLIARPTTGPTRFEARITKDDKAVTDAEVSLNLTMPYHKHGGMTEKVPAVNADLQAGSAQYAKTIKLKMEGIYVARLMVRQGKEKGSATYRFSAHSKPAVAHLGMWHPAGGFEVRLTTDPAKPKSGANTLRVEVTREGYAVTDASVAVRLIMPGMSRMGGSEAYTKLTSQNGAYEGSADLAHDGDWRAYITVQSGEAKGAATYDFKVGK
jgi:hypothetical protein